MFRLYGFLASNYVQMVHFVLLEKGMEFEIIPEMPTQEAAFKAKSAMGKVPVLDTEQGFLTEANVIMEYLEDLQPNPSLLPPDPFERARVRELTKECELYVELAARRNYPEIYYGRGRSDAAFEEARPVLENAV
ncbi:MAG TPA: glutathione S-transferase family protein, partial [Gammaproteobacteria bacterium]|nr:glutathione S-transferase family protein [Gammaproteobacteria bacterium]